MIQGYWIIKVEICQKKVKYFILKYIDIDNSDNSFRDAILKEELKKDRIIFPLNKYKYTLFTFVLLVIFSFLKGSEHLKSIIGVTP